jgi:quinolinate synthase
MSLESKKLQEEIVGLKEKKNAILLAHNYQRREIQEIADFVGDSLELARKATKVDGDIIVFCGVDFMAETASILNPDKKVLIPSIEARCPMAAQLPTEIVRKAIKSEPDVPFVIYVNSLAEAKAEADVCCTSANVAKVVEALDSEKVFLGPDANLAWFAEQRSGKKVVAVPENGYCYVHKYFKKDDVLRLRNKYPNAAIIVHPECDPEIQLLADYVGSTSQMVKYAKETKAEKIVVGTEIGLIDRMKKENPEKTFIPLHDAICREMKMNSLEKIRDVLKYEKNVVRVPEKIAEKALKAVERMLEIV